MTTIGRSIPHDSARGHVTGAARYIDDLPRVEGELEVVFAGSPAARGTIRSIDVEAARAAPGVVAVLTHHDVPGHNRWGPIEADEPFLADVEVRYLGQPVAAIAAITREAAERARTLVRVEVDEEAPVLTIDDAIARGEFLTPERFIRCGDLEAGWARATHRLEGTFRSGGQEQLYFESQAAIAIPGEDGQMVVHSSTQNPTEIQTVVAEALGVGRHRVVAICKRMGGGFGGKETQGSIPAALAALVAQRTGRPARIVYGKDDDMAVTGKRHPYRSRYRVGFDELGVITAFELELRSDGGAYLDLSSAVLERSMLHADNAYRFENASISGRVCRTNLPPSTAFRGFGGPQGMAVIENVIQEIAIQLGRDSLDVRRANAYGRDPSEQRPNRTPYGQEVRANLVPEMLERLAAEGDYGRRRAEIEHENRASPTSLRGLAMTPVKFGISFTNKTLNQANALVNVFTDGSVQVSTGATEMGQGVNTKIAQLVADELGVDYEAVTVMPTSTEKNNNTSPTAASASTDLNGTAAVRACEQIRSRMAGLAARLLKAGDDEQAAARLRFADGAIRDAESGASISFAELATAAHRERLDLGARGFYATPDIDYDRESGRGTPFYYFTTGCALAEVRIERLTGELWVERLDVLLDIGRVINPGIERGQAIGGLVQGIGWVSTEELVYGERGELLSASPTTYKIPNVSDLPAHFRLDFVENELNRHNLKSTKAVGEPPLMLGLAVWCAIKDALASIRPGLVPQLRLPATHEAILDAIVALEDSPRELEAPAPREPATAATSIEADQGVATTQAELRAPSRT
ncbi:MAG TPA: xanthine dehydrogenase molybdopterin binding subunit [Thermoanaerobaculia bacterium]|nr:xanthine dehydrogenase molybdopterin binding subunit [Thermoanaerobaculia bacterium]